MKNGFRQSMAWLHTWSGLLAGWLLFAVFLTGTASYYRDEISLWMRPELQLAPVAPAGAAERGLARLRALSPLADEWLLDLPDSRQPILTVMARGDGKAAPRFLREYLDPASGLPIRARETYGGDFLYYFHFDLQTPNPWGRLVVGLAAMFMLVGIVSGVITHRRIFRDFFTFRSGRGQRSWLDAHNAMGVLALPYHLMITYSGLVTLMVLYMPWGIDAAYPEGRAAFNDALFGEPPPQQRSGRPADLAALEPLFAAAARHWQGDLPGRLIVTNPGDAEASILLRRGDEARLSYAAEVLVFQGASGRLLEAGAPAGAAEATRGVLYGLHLGRFADPLLRALFFLSGLAGSGMVATGLLLWVVKRRPDPGQGPAGFGHRLVERLNVGVLAGLPIAIAAHFWSNRLLPLELTPALGGRGEWEGGCFFLAWLAMLLHGFARPPAAGWREQLWLSAGLFALLPLLNALTTDRHLGNSLFRGDWALAGFDLVMLASGLLLALLARKAERIAAKRGADS